VREGTRGGKTRERKQPGGEGEGRKERGGRGREGGREGASDEVGGRRRFRRRKNKKNAPRLNAAHASFK